MCAIRFLFTGRYSPPEISDLQHTIANLLISMLFALSLLIDIKSITLKILFPVIFQNVFDVYFFKILNLSFLVLISI